MRLTLTIVALAGLVLAASGRAAETAPAKAEKPQVVSLTLHPAAAPCPALKLRLLPKFSEQTTGNAAPLYLKAFLALADCKLDDQAWQQVIQWLETPLAELPKEDVRKTLEPTGEVLRLVAIAARRSECDWALSTREEENPFTMVLPELQHARSVGRLLALRMRLAIAEKRFGPALDDLKTGLALARHTAAAPMLVNGLVAMAIARTMEDQLQTLVQQPGAPNLYWALTTLPDPMVDLHPALMMEADIADQIVARLFPEVSGPSRPSLTEAQWQTALEQTADRVAKLLGLAADSQTEVASWKKTLTPAMAKAAAAAAKADLIRQGWAEAEVRKMCAPEAVLCDVFAAFGAYRDELFKWFVLPCWQAEAGRQQAEAIFADRGEKEDPLKKACLTFPRLLTPAIGKCQERMADTQRHVAALRTIEAVRAYAAGHGGKLPASLEAIQGMPISINPVTGKSFGYRIEGNAAVLVADGGPVDQQVHYRLTMAK